MLNVLCWHWLLVWAIVIIVNVCVEISTVLCLSFWELPSLDCRQCVEVVHSQKHLFFVNSVPQVGHIVHEICQEMRGWAHCGNLQYSLWILVYRKHSGHCNTWACNNAFGNFQLLLLMYSHSQHCFVNNAVFFLLLAGRKAASVITLYSRNFTSPYGVGLLGLQSSKKLLFFSGGSNQGVESNLNQNFG